ncbi:hypothetical protein Xaut_0351 [Xanthobacter versatilis]|uniref:Uncharacterized protein n=1 Tax=Xanthobacter autotrophicus (strain ATCC BAA-1158 / Py2) TaxID=78245 RepID=A7IC66_XANP2|nr:hypothetical protein Xaut_0351 [Xanthobacter autotrophicus Py2]
MKGARKVILGAGMGALLVSSVSADEPRRLTAQYYYDRALTAEMVLLDAIRANKPRRILTLYNALVDEIDILAGPRVSSDSSGMCAFLMHALAAVTLTTYGHMERRAQSTAMANGAWTKYREVVSRCERQPGVVVFDRKLPENLSEVF